MSDEKKKSGPPSNSKEISFTPFLTNILKPSAEMAGLELKEYLKSKIDSWKEKRRSENITEHVQKVQEELGEPSDKGKNTNSIKQLELFTEWAEGAQDIGANEGVIAKLWQKLLIEISNGNTPNSNMIEVLKKLNAEEAKLLLKISNRGSLITSREKDLHYLVSLEKLGLVKPINIIPIVILVLGAWFFLMFLVGSFRDVFGEYSLVMNSSNMQLAIYGFPLLMAGVAVYQMYKRKMLYRWRLSWLGVELVKGVESTNP